MNSLRGTLRIALLSLGVAVALCAAAAPASGQQFTIDAKADSIGPIVTDSAGNGYIAWERSASPDIPMFCKLAPGDTKCAHPVTLSLPGGGASDGALALFPIVGPGKVVWVVTDRYIRDDTLIWTSNNGGKSFGAAHVIPHGNECPPGGSCEESEPYTGLLSLSDTLPITNSGDTYNGQKYLDATNTPYVTFLQSSTDPGLGWDWDATDVIYQFEPGISEFTFSNAPSFVDIVDSALGTTSTGDVVEAYTTDGEPNDAVQYFAYRPTSTYPSVLSATQTGWSGPTSFSSSYAPRMADGHAGMFMVTASDPSGKSQSIELRKWDSSSHKFAAPKQLATIAPAFDGDGGGIGENYSTGKLAVVWPTQTPSGKSVLGLLVSTDGGSHFAPMQEIGTVAGYGGFGTARVAIANDGNGFVTYQDSSGLEVVQLYPTAAQYKSLKPASGKLPVSVSCSTISHPCSAKLSLKVHQASTSHTFSLRAGTTSSLKLPLTHALLAAIGHSHPSSTLTLTLSSQSDQLYRIVAHPKL